MPGSEHGGAPFSEMPDTITGVVRELGSLDARVRGIEKSSDRFLTLMENAARRMSDEAVKFATVAERIEVTCATMQAAHGELSARVMRMSQKLSVLQLDEARQDGANSVKRGIWEQFGSKIAWGVIVVILTLAGSSVASMIARAGAISASRAAVYEALRAAPAPLKGAP